MIFPNSTAISVLINITVLCSFYLFVIVECRWKKAELMHGPPNVVARLLAPPPQMGIGVEESAGLDHQAVFPHVWSLTQFHSVDFSQSRICVKRCVFKKPSVKICVSCFWRCPGHCASSAAHLTVFLYLGSS